MNEHFQSKLKEKCNLKYNGTLEKALYSLWCPVSVPHKTWGFWPDLPVMVNESVHTPVVVTSVMSKLSKSNLIWQISEIYNILTSFHPLQLADDYLLQNYYSYVSNKQGAIINEQPFNSKVFPPHFFIYCYVVPNKRKK